MPQPPKPNRDSWGHPAVLNVINWGDPHSVDLGINTVRTSAEQRCNSLVVWPQKADRSSQDAGHADDRAVPQPVRAISSHKAKAPPCQPASPWRPSFGTTRRTHFPGFDGRRLQMSMARSQLKPPRIQGTAPCRTWNDDPGSRNLKTLKLAHSGNGHRHFKRRRQTREIVHLVVPNDGLQGLRVGQGGAVEPYVEDMPHQRCGTARSSA